MALEPVDYIGAALETPWEESPELREKRWWRIHRTERKERRQQARAAVQAIGDLNVLDLSKVAERTDG